MEAAAVVFDMSIGEVGVGSASLINEGLSRVRTRDGRTYEALKDELLFLARISSEEETMALEEVIKNHLPEIIATLLQEMLKAREIQSQFSPREF